MTINEQYANYFTHHLPPTTYTTFPDTNVYESDYIYTLEARPTTYLEGRVTELERQVKELVVLVTELRMKEYI